MSTSAKGFRSYSVEGIVAALAALVCLGVTLAAWWSLSQQQAMWPLPALYLIEVVLLAAAGAGGVFRADEGGSLLAWAATGALLGFSILGGFSIGFFYLPVVALLGLAALWHDRRAWGRLPLHLGMALLAGVAQAAMMLAVIQMLYPSGVA